jgi:GNAT superfamily N-acetyltransferase
VSGDPPQLTRLDPADLDTVRAMHGVELAAQQVDGPQGPPWSARVFQAQITLGPPLAEPNEAWFVPAGDYPGVAGWYSLRFPDRENLEWAVLRLTVHPARRRQGLGTGLLRHAARRAAASGRTGIVSTIQHGSAGDAFASQCGATRGIDDILRVLDLRLVPTARFSDLRSTAARLAAGYSLISWAGATPPERLAGIAGMFNTMNDAPRDAVQEPSTWDADRVRLDDERVAASWARQYTVAAIHDGTGELAAYTELRVPPDLRHWGYQGNTAVLRAHRGHRLGLLVKAAMLESLAASERQLERIATWNAAANEHMIAVNEQLGFEVAGRPYCFATLEVARVLEAAGAPGPEPAAQS